jgi:deoxyribonuclease IV
MLLGVHCSVSGGVHNAFKEVEALGIDTFQIFTKNQKQWRDPDLKPEVVDSFRKKSTEFKIPVKFSHASYLLNLASSDSLILENSIRAMIAEVERCHQLGLDFTVFHPGYAKGIGEGEAIKKIAQSLKIVLNETAFSEVGILLENTAGQGTSIGGRIEHLAGIIDQTESERIGICIDTCHAFAYGYDITTQSGFEDLINLTEKLIGLEKLKAFHLNDSKGGLGTKLDRHEHIGKGKLGLEPFRLIMKNFQHIPKVLETPKEGGMDAVNLEVLRNL